MKNTFSITVDYDRGICSAIGEGAYDCVLNFESLTDHTTEKSGKDKIEVKLLCFRGLLTTEKILSKIDKKGYRPAEVFELLAFGAQHPELQRKFTIVALGTSAHQHRHSYTPCLTGSTTIRRLETLFNLEKEPCQWTDRYRFLVVKKSLPTNT